LHPISNQQFPPCPPSPSFPSDIAPRFLTLYRDGFSFTTTNTLAVLTNRYRVKVIPISYHRRVGKSSIHPVRDFTDFTISSSASALTSSR
jgi:hypothetical protein